MKLDFAGQTRRNMAATAANTALRMLFPFLNRTLFLWLLGPEFLGLNGLFASVIGVLSMAELGFGGAVISSMYKPVAEDDRDLLRAYLAFYRTAYRWVGAGIFCAGMCLMPFLRSLVHGSVPPGMDLHVLYFIHLVNAASSYLLYSHRCSVLAAHNRRDVLVNVNSAVSAAQYLAGFLVLLFTRNYYLYVVTTVVFTLLQNLAYLHESRRLFPWLEPAGKLPEDKRRKVVSDVKAVFLHKVGGVISNSSDNLVISAFLGLVAIAAYGNYYYVLTSVGGLVGMICVSMTGGFGNRIHTESKEDCFRLFMKTARLAQISILWCVAMLTALYQPFITVWTKGDPALVRHFLTPALMVLFFYVNQSRQMLLTFKTAAAIWRQDRWKPIVAGAVNLSFNVAFVVLLPGEYKLDGVILSTIIGYVCVQIPWETHAVFANFFGPGPARVYRRFHARFAALALALCAATWCAASAGGLPGVPGLLAKGCVSAAVSGGALAAIFRRDLAEALVRLRRGR